MEFLRIVAKKQYEKLVYKNEKRPLSGCPKLPAGFLEKLIFGNRKSDMKYHVKQREVIAQGPDFCHIIEHCHCDLKEITNA